MDKQDLERLAKVFYRLTDPVEGSRYSAANGVYEMLKRQNVDIRDIHLAYLENSSAPQHLEERMKRWEESEKHYEKLQRTIDRINKSHEETKAWMDAQVAALNAKNLKLTTENQKLKADKKDRRTVEIIGLQARVKELEGHIGDLEAYLDPRPPLWEVGAKALSNLKIRIKELEAKEATIAPLHARITELEAALKAASSNTIAALNAHIIELEVQLDEVPALRTQINNLQAQVKHLEDERAAAEPDPDRWQTKVENWLAEDADWRYASCTILEEACGIPMAIQDIDAFRRLGRIMRIIGGWTESTNIPFDGRRVRGYQKKRYE